MNYLVIDLEMCKVPKDYRNKNYKYASEIIQIGAVLLDERYRRRDEICLYVHPEHGVIDNFIANMTGIKNRQIKNAPKLRERLLELTEWIGDREYQVFAWSNSDFSQLSHEVRSKKLQDEKIQSFMAPERWIDYQEVFGKKYSFEKAVSLQEALMLCDLTQDGRMHDGLDDALNTAKLIRKLELNPEYQLICRQTLTEEESNPLNICLGDLFAGLHIECA